MRTSLPVFIVVGCLWTGAAAGQPAEADFWRSVQQSCTQTAAKPANDAGRLIAQLAIDEFERFGGHQIDSDGRMYRFGVVESEQEEDDKGDRKARLGHLGWWQVLKYWRALRGSNKDAADAMRVWAYQEATDETADDTTADLLQANVAKLLEIIEGTTASKAEKELLKESVFRAAISDNAWSAAFISYILKEAKVSASQFRFASGHRFYIYDAFSTSASEVNNKPDSRLYRACPIHATKPRVGDLLCYHREVRLEKFTDDEVRARILSEIDAADDVRSVSKSHCDIVAHVDTAAKSVYVIGGNVFQSVTIKKLPLGEGDLAFSKDYKGNCPSWTLPPATAGTPPAPSLSTKCSLSDKHWFVLLQMR
jgi:hypothetical protein